MAQVGSCLPGFVAHHQRLRIYEAEGVDDDFSFYGLDRVDDDCNSTGCELFEGLLGVDIDGGEPAAKSGMGMVPSYHGFVSTCLP